VKDECAHRACPLSLGKVVDGKVSCAYHGWEFDGDGSCTKMPSTVHCRNIGVAALPTAEKDGFVWVWPGDDVPGDVPEFTRPPEGYTVHSEVGAPRCAATGAALRCAPAGCSYAASEAGAGAGAGAGACGSRRCSCTTAGRRAGACWPRATCAGSAGQEAAAAKGGTPSGRAA
jgi:hypothetical protein